SAGVRAFQTTLFFDADCALITLSAWPQISGAGVISGSPNEFLEFEEWNIWRQENGDAANWFRSVAQYVLNQMHDAFEKSVRVGVSRIRARKNSALAPFDRVHLDQWQYFSVDEPICPAPDARKWIDPLFSSWTFSSPKQGNSATGPQGEKLF